MVVTLHYREPACTKYSIYGPICCSIYCVATVATGVPAGTNIQFIAPFTAPFTVLQWLRHHLKDHRYNLSNDRRPASFGPTLPPRIHPLVIKEEVFSNTSFMTQNIDHFPTRLPKKPTERELPDPMVALGATAVYASLVEYRMTGRRQNIPFTEDAYEDIYRNHIATLEQTCKNARKGMHRILHELFTEVT
ncbi:hypothetical protein B0H14DRAFT_3151326 [Mycena olivaceomarginata]|nr:hypothetical protein B0H14DRAFT_3151326 [Mycena olivaceomarginata]